MLNRSKISRRGLITGAAALVSLQALGEGIRDTGAAGIGAQDGPLGGVTGAPYLGQVATRCFAASTTFASTMGCNCRTAHYARDNVTSLQVVFGNWYSVFQVGDSSQGGTQTITASIEYPKGVYNRVKFSGANSVVVADGANIVSDPVAISIPKGALFWTKRYQVNAVALQYCAAGGNPTPNLALGDALNSSNVDETATASVDYGYGAIAPPLAIIAQTRLPSIGIIGASRAVGLSDTTVDATGNTGYCRLVGDSFAYTCMAVSGDTMAAQVSNSPKRLAILDAYVSHRWIDPPGLNDFARGASAATVLQQLATLAARWPLSKVIVNDEGPCTASTDRWATTANQKASGVEAERVALNTGIQALAGYNQIVRVAALATAAGSSFAWVNNGAAFGFTPDGLHENTALLLAMKAANPFTPSLVR
jgi:hypothetical protein